MLFMQTIIEVKGLSAKEITDFLLNCNDDNYRQWWRDVHLEFHQLKSSPGHIGDLVYMDEHIGKFRMTAKARVTKLIPGKLIVWQVTRIIRMPIVLTLKLEDTVDGVIISHTIEAGFRRMGKLFDFILRFYMPRGFEDEMDKHVKTEFPKLRDLLRACAST